MKVKNLTDDEILQMVGKHEASYSLDMRPVKTFDYLSFARAIIKAHHAIQDKQESNIESKCSISKYVLISQSYSDDLNNTVNEYMEDGWELYNAPLVLEVDERLFFYQAMVKP